MTPEQIHDIGRRRAWVIWLVALAVYVLAVFHRSSLGVASNANREIKTQWEASAVAVEMKEFAKKKAGSSYEIDRRTR